MYYVSCDVLGNDFVPRLQVLYVFGVMGLDLRDHNCYLLKNRNQKESAASHPAELGLELITKDGELRKDPEIDALVVKNFSPSANCKNALNLLEYVRVCYSASSPSSLITLFVAYMFTPVGNDNIGSIWCLATLSIISASSLDGVDSILSRWCALNNFDIFLILFACWVRGHDGFYICNLCTLTWIWQCCCTNAPHWLIFHFYVKRGGMEILLWVWAYYPVWTAYFAELSGSGIGDCQLNRRYTISRARCDSRMAPLMHPDELWFDILNAFQAPLIQAKALVLGLYFGLLICVDSW